MVTPTNRAGRLPGALVAVGALVFLAASFTPVGGDVYSAEGASEVAAALEGARGTWNAANLVSAVGVVVAAVGLFLLGRNLRRGGQHFRTRRAARIVTLLGLATAIEAVLLVWNATASIDSLATTYGDPTGSALLVTLGLAWTLAALGVFIGLGLALLWFPHRRWLGWLVLVLGPVTTILMSAFAGPDPAYLLLLICGITLWVSPPPAPQ